MSAPDQATSTPKGRRPLQDTSVRSTAQESEAGQLGFFFEQPAPPQEPQSQPSVAPSAAAVPTRRRVAPRADTLPAWARAAMPAKPVPEPEPDLLEDEPEGEPTRRVWRVAELVGEVRGHIEGAYPDLWVRGEISNLRAAPSGHLYFTLKDGEASLPAVLFRRQAQLLRFRPEDGLEVLLRGRVSVYEQRGQMQLIAEYLEPVGAGSLQLAFEQLKRRLEAEGLFAMDRKRPLPTFPHCVGIVTSPAGAVIRDFLNVAGRRHAALDVLLYPATVQGETAAAEVAAGIAWFNRMRNVDVIVIARGGGSLEDLAPFNSELVARAIAVSTLPVVSAVGHETDFTIADFVADLRAPTPSAAAELITAAQHRIEEHVEALEARLGRAVRYSFSLARQRLAALETERSFARVSDGLRRREQRADEQRFRLERAGMALIRAACDRAAQARAALLRQDATHRLRVMRERFFGLQTRLERAAVERLGLAHRHFAPGERALLRYDGLAMLERRQLQLSGLHGRLLRSCGARVTNAKYQQETAARALLSLSPLAVLGRGYALVFAADGTLIKQARAAHAGDAVRLQLADGALSATITGEAAATEDIA